MWRYLPPAVLMACSALVLIAGATGDLQSWSQSLDSLPSWRTIVDARPWSPATDIWDAGRALLKRKADTPAAPSIAPAAASNVTPIAAPAHSSGTPATPQPSDHQGVAAPPALATAAAQLPPPAPARERAAASPLQQRLIDARRAIAAGRAGEARKMLEKARAGMVVRPTREGNSVQIDMPATWLGRALSSLNSGDSSGALHELDLAIASS